MADPAAQRRRAGTAVLSNVLDEASMLQALWMVQDSMRGDQVSDIIRCVDAIAQRFMIDSTACKRLYNEFYRTLREPEDRLPLDPWPAMQALRPAPPAAAPRPAPPPAYWPPAAPMYAAPPMMPPPGYPAQMMSPQQAQFMAQQMAQMAQPMSQPMYAPAYMPAADVMAQAQQMAPVATLVAAPPAVPVIAVEPPVIYGAVMRELVREVHDFHREALDEVRRDALKALEGARVEPALQQRCRDAWARARQDDWQLQATHADLAELTRVVFAALTEAFGRVGADQILQRALAQAESLPEARQFSPKRLLAAM
jgi:cell division septum initiation protein DivIVA